MSWVKKRGQSPAAAPPPVNMYNPNQAPTQDWQQMQQQGNYWQQPYQQNQPSYQHTQQTQQQPQQYSQPYYQQQNSNSNSFNQQPQIQQAPQQQNYANLQYNQQFTAPNLYGNQPQQQQPQQQAEGDGWGTNWGWGDEDNSNLVTPSNSTTTMQQQPAANLIVESFANDESWNWGVEDSKKSELGADLKTNPSIERITGKRGKLETPQWSVESQLSQESSDDVLQTSESDKSRMMSRSSTISHSPISGQDLGAVVAVDDSRLEFNVTENKEVIQKQMTPPPPIMMAPQNGDDSNLKSNPFKRTSGLPKYAMPVNLETLPDNSEQPDQVQSFHVPVAPTRPNPPENNETPINDRNQYLETGQLSDVDLNSFSQEDTLPPPGLRRMVLGQMEQDIAPPSLSTRVVPGQQENGPVNQSLNSNSEPPEGLHRMIPGESSSPESVLRQQPRQDSEPEINEMGAPQRRSATIGADMSPDTSKNSQEPSRGRVPSASSGENRRGKKGKSNKQQRRDSVEGENVEGDVGALVSSVRNLTVDSDENVNHQSERQRRHSRQEQSSESDREGKSKRNRGGRYSPEDYRDKRYNNSNTSDPRRRYKDRKYEEDTDYLSDKERRYRDDREYDRKYNSLRKEKDKERRKREDPRYHGGRRGEYYNRYEEDFENESRSRASSRSDSMHENYRGYDRGDRGYDRDRRDRRHHREKDRERHRRPKDPYTSYGQGFGYDMYSQYYQQYQYYENLRKTNPQAYAQLYRKYYQEAGSASGASPFVVGEDSRGSVHSGRSSANDELAKDSFVRTLDQTDTSLNYEDPQLAAQRLTPAKFATAHIKASIASGKLVKVLPHYPLDGQTPAVELCQLETLLYGDEEFQELQKFPGPLVKGVTHKKTIIEYCENKIRGASSNPDIHDQDSYVLMWELLILLIRQNGMVVGTDIAELLLKNHEMDQLQTQRSASVMSSVGSVGNDNSDGHNPATDNPNSQSESASNLKEEEVTNKFREYLLYGSHKEALEWAMKHGLWGHALFLASKLDKRTYANVLMRFANGLTMNDPLQTLYQLLSGRTPAAATCVADEKWGDWRPHLAMILSNSTHRPELNCRAITTLGDTLMSRGSLYAAQFCYLMAQVGFGTHGSPEAKLVLLGADHSKPFLHFSTNEAIHMTEIYEYACSLNDDNFALLNFQRYKYLLATRLSDVGLLERSLAYLEKIANFMVKNPTGLEADLVNQVANLSDRLKYYDPVGDGDDEGDLDTSRPDNSWLKELRKIQNDYNMGLIAPQSYISGGGYQQEESSYGQDLYNQQPQQTQFENYQQQPQQQWGVDQQQVQQIETQQAADYQQPQQQDNYSATQFGQDQQPQQYWQGQQTWGSSTDNSYIQEPSDPQQQPNFYGSSLAQNEDTPPSQISLPNQPRGDLKPQEQLQENQKSKPDAKPSKPNADQVPNKQGTGWFGGIFSKLTLKPKNQMKLPDDKNPSIVWDPERKKWVNVDQDNGDETVDFKPPPKMSEMPGSPMSSGPIFNHPMQPQTLNSVTNPNPSFPAVNSTPVAAVAPNLANNNNEAVGAPMKNAPPNMFKLQKGRSLKKSYIDVFNPGAKAGVAPQPAAPAAPQMNFFVPQPINDPNAPTDFLTPGGVPVMPEDMAQVAKNQ